MFEKICRLCLSEKNDLKTISHNEDISAKIRECVTINLLDDELPTTVCSSCIQKIQNWVVFKEMCLQSSKILLQRKSNIFIQDRTNDFHKQDLYKCDVCQAKFCTCLNYLDHQSEHNGQPVFGCDKCSKIFSTRNALEAHDRDHKFSSSQCGKLVQKTSMKLHMIKHTERYKCIECFNCFNSETGLKQHTITAHTDEKNYICDICEKTFATKTSLTVHMKSHSKNRTYKCKLCCYAGRTASAVYMHMATHSTDICICSTCSKTFKSLRNLKDHLRRAHNEDKKHQCHICNKKFVDKYVLTAHVRTHTGVKPYVCKQCNKTFVRSDSLKQHMKTHQENRVVSVCDKCGKTFLTAKGHSRHRCQGMH